MTETLTRAKPQIDDPKELDRVVRRLVEAFEPVAIYLFGSRARGDASEDSDYDVMLVLRDDPIRAISRQAIWDTAHSDRINVNPFRTRVAAFAWRRNEVGTLEYEVQVDGIRLHPMSGADLRLGGSRTNGQVSMNRAVVEEWLERVRRDLVMAEKACKGDDAVPDQGAYHVQQAAEKLTKAALVAKEIRPRKGHVIGEFARRLPSAFADRKRFLALKRFSKFAWLHCYPSEPGAPPEPEPAAKEVLSWIAEVQTPKADFETWLAARKTTP